MGKTGQPLHLPDEVVADFYRLADILLFPSRYEGFGIPVLEASLVRLPIFAADIPSIRESADDLVYLFNPDGDPEAVGEAIVTYLESCQTYQMRRRVYHRYTWEAVVNQRLIPLIREILKL
jgi:glycosyltransferase involved in cell wall biosynthesis